MLQWSLEAFFGLGERLGEVVVPLAREILDAPPDFLKTLPKSVHLCEGGATRQRSVHAGLELLRSLGRGSDMILVHDAARPLLSQGDLRHLIEVIETSGEGALLATPVRDTIKRSVDGSSVKETVDRSPLWQAQTPQGAPGELLWRASCRALEKEWQVTDDASLLEQDGVKVHLVQSKDPNFKVTLPEDWVLFTQMS